MDPRHDVARDALLAAAKSAPPATIACLTLNEWVAIATIAYIVLQTAHLVWKWRREAKGGASGRERGADA
jgi:hypothetical protein